MIYLSKTDIEIYLQAIILSKLTGGSDLVLDKHEVHAIGTFKKYIGKRYNASAVIATKTNSQNEDIRDQFVVKLLCHLVIYGLYTKLAPHEIPEHRKFDYQEAMEWLREVGNGKVDADFPLLINEETEEEITDVRINSYPKQNHRF